MTVGGAIPLLAEVALMAAIPAFRARRERAMALLGVVQVAIILAAAATACLRQFV